MKNMMKTVIAFLLFTTIIFSQISPITALALDTEIKNSSIAYVWSDGDYDNGEYYSTVKSAWNAALKYGNILLLKDWKTDTSLTVSKSKSVTIYMNDFSIDRGLDSPQKNGEIFTVNKRSNLIIYGGDSADKNARSETAKLTGGYSSSGGGAMNIQESAGVYLYGISITGNKTTHSKGGGAIRFQGKSIRFQMNENTYITDNASIGADGGAISVQAGNCVIIGGNVTSNRSDKNGGAITTLESCSISNVIIKNNEATLNGGGVYMSKGGGASLSGCTIEDNTAGENGGGVYIASSGSLSGGTVQNNVAGDLGGGAFVSAGASIGLSGNLTVKNNNDSVLDDIESDNIYLHIVAKDDKMAKISSYPSGGEVHIGWNSSLQSEDAFRISKSEGMYSTKFLVSDVENYCFYWSWDSTDDKNDRYIWADTTNYSRDISFSTITVPVSDRYHIIENGYEGKYDLQEGLLGYQSSSSGNRATVYFYSDGYFAAAPDVYNSSLATMSYVLADSASTAGGTIWSNDLPGGAYSNSFRNAIMLLSDIGIQDKDISVNEDFEIEPTKDTIATVVGAKEITLDGEAYILIPVSVRGGGYGAEWASNFTLSIEGEAYGFSSAATKVINHIESFINSNTSFDIPTALSEGKVKFWVVGFSRGGAVANLTAKRLTDTYGEAGNLIYGYSFETPKGGTDVAQIYEPWTYNGVYANIHNIINPGDFIPSVAPSSMGFKRYGVDHYLPGTDAGNIITTTKTTDNGLTVTTHRDNVGYGWGNESYEDQRTLMKQHLATIDPSIIFYDYFSLASLDYLAILSGSDMIAELDDEFHIPVEEWLEALMTDLSKWAANGSYSDGKPNNGGYNGDYRDFYASNSEFAGQELVTIEEALIYFFELMYTFEDSEELISILTLRLSKALENYEILFDLYFNIVKKWDELSKEKQLEMLDNIWNSLDGDLEEPGAIPVKKITDFVQGEDLEELKTAVYSLASFLFMFVCRDHDNQPSIENVDVTHVHIGTLLYNISSIMDNHNPNICYAWLYSYDDNYSRDNEISKYTNKAVYLIGDEVNKAPEVQAEIKHKNDTITITLSSVINSTEGVDAKSTANGSAIYYAVFENGNIVGTWELYRGPITLDKSLDVEYTVKAFASRFAEKGKETELSNAQIRAIPDGPIYTVNPIPTIIGIASMVALALVLILIPAIKKKKRKKATAETK